MDCVLSFPVGFRRNTLFCARGPCAFGQGRRADELKCCGHSVWLEGSAIVGKCSGVHKLVVRAVGRERPRVVGLAGGGYHGRARILGATVIATSPRDEMAPLTRKIWPVTGPDRW